jgi:hypothetical protein
MSSNSAAGTSRAAAGEAAKEDGLIGIQAVIRVIAGAKL